MIPYRKSVASLLDKLKLGINGMEIFGARTAEPLQTCIEEVKKSKTFIGIIGMRYGSIDPESGKSFVQIEYDTAFNERLDILIYIIDPEKALLPPIFVDKDENSKKLDEFKAHLRKNHTVEFFTTPSDLAEKIEKDIIRVLKERKIIIDEEKLEPLSDEKTTIEVLKKFKKMPKLLDGKEVELIVEFTGDSDITPQRVCNALKLSYGASISRRIKIIEPKDANFEYYRFLQELYAEEERCEFLYNAKINRQYKIIAKLSFGFMLEIVDTSSWSLLFGERKSPILNLNTREKIEKYIKYEPIEALIFVKNA